MTDPLPTGVVTLLFTDIEGSSRILEQASAGYGRLLADHRLLLREAWAAHDGVEVDTQGDAFLVAFASARSGALAAAQAHERLAAHDWGGHPAVVVRIGVHTGTPERGDEAHVHRELGNPMRADVDRILATVEERIDVDLVPAARTRAAELGVAGGLAWLEETALTDAP